MPGASAPEPVLVPVPIRTALRCWLVFGVFDTALFMLLFRSGFAGSIGPFIAIGTFISTIAGSTARLRPRHAFAALAAAFAIGFGFALAAGHALATRPDLLFRVGVNALIATVAAVAFVGITHLPPRRAKAAAGAV
jgi:hypothetical protein